MILLLEHFGSNIRSQEAQSTLMSISQGQRLVCDYVSQFETLLGRLDSYNENMMLDQFIWGLQPELARSVSLQYLKSIAQAVSLAETTELAVKASRRPAGKISGGGNTPKGPTSSNRGQGRWRGNAGRGGGAVVEDEVYLGTEDQAFVVEEEEEEILDMIPWHASVVGCAVIWLVTVPLLVARQ